MTVVKMQSEAKAGGTASAGATMDRQVSVRGLSRRGKIAIGFALTAALAGVIYGFAPDNNSQSIAANQLSIATVRKGQFDDFIPLRGRVTPLLTVYLDAIEGGRVEKVIAEDGATVQAGQLLAVLSNAELQLSVLARQTEVTQQLNSMRSQELALSQNRLTNERGVLEADLALRRAERQFAREAPLAEKGFVPGRVFSETTDELAYQRHRNEVLRRAQATDENLQSSQLAQLRGSSATLETSLELARNNLESLNLRAPVAGTLSAFAIQVGQSMARGERIGQIDSPGRNKLVATVDEFYLGRVNPGQLASVEWAGKRHSLKVSKISPQVRNGGFEIDLQFTTAEPTQIQRGQTLQPRLVLGDPVPALLIPNGAFYSETGGSWIFVVAPNGKYAVKRPVRMGRRNSDFIEILDGLDAGERVITSPYTGYSDKNRIDFETK